MSSRRSNTRRSLSWFRYSCACLVAELQKSKGQSMKPLSRYLQSCWPTGWRSSSFKACQTWCLRWMTLNATRITVEQWCLWQICQFPRVKSLVGPIAWSFATAEQQCSKPLLVDDFGVIVQSNMSGLLQSFTIIVLFPLDLGNRFLTNQHNDA